MGQFKSFHFLIIGAFLVGIYACSSESTSEVSKKSNTVKTENLDEMDTLFDMIICKIRIPYVQASNGFEYQVAEYLQENYLKGELISIVNGAGKKMNPETNKVFLEKELYTNTSLDFFHGKWPEFLISPDSTDGDIPLMLSNIQVNSEHFMEGDASDFLLKKENYRIGDLQIIISKAFFYKGYYYVHAWRFSNSTKVFHERQQTFKFDKMGRLLDVGSLNYHQKGYSTVRDFLKAINTKP